MTELPEAGWPQDAGSQVLVVLWLAGARSSSGMVCEELVHR